MDDELERLKERGWREVAAIDAALARGDVDEEGWHRAMAELVVPAYLAGESPRAQSGHSGDEARWEGARRLLLDAIDGDGSVLDVGCANGHLMECLQAWAAEDGITLEPWGLEISAELADLARDRLPRWRERIFVGNAVHWTPGRRFDYVRTNVDYAPPPRRAELLRHLLDHVVAPRGRLVVGVYNEEVEQPALEAAVTSWGFVVAGRAERAHPDSARVVRRAFWIEANR
ncbi:MAG TPA: class I SAM-dependent methyltransferase [Gaiellaceae bacterium]|nr:class I SAM-dependent methyltransferase [Gaiellaceae bacterium]